MSYSTLIGYPTWVLFLATVSCPFHVSAGDSWPDKAWTKVNARDVLLDEQQLEKARDYRLTDVHGRVVMKIFV